MREELEKIGFEVTGHWYVGTKLHMTEFWSFDGDSYCVSESTHANGMRTYVVSSIRETMYSGQSKQEAIKCLRRIRKSTEGRRA